MGVSVHLCFIQLVTLWNEKQRFKAWKDPVLFLGFPGPSLQRAKYRLCYIAMNRCSANTSLLAQMAGFHNRVVLYDGAQNVTQHSTMMFQAYQIVDGPSAIHWKVWENRQPNDSQLWLRMAKNENQRSLQLRRVFWHPYYSNE